MNCYNGEQFIREAISSVLAQTYTDYELVIWDNVSTDQSWQIISEYDDPRIVPIRATMHTTLAEARKLAFPYLRGNWIGILDVDDLWREDKLQKQMCLALENPRLGFIYCKTSLLSESASLKADHVFCKTKGDLPEGDVYHALLRGNFIAIASLLINKTHFQAIGGFSGRFPIMEDYYVTLNLARLYPVTAVQEPLCEYRLHGGNDSLRAPLDTFEDLKIVRELFPDPYAMLAALRIVVRHFKKCLIYKKIPNVRQMTQALV